MMTDLRTRNRSPGGGCGGSRNEAAGGQLQGDNTRNRSAVSTEIDIAALSRALDAFIEAAIEIKDVLDGDPDLEEPGDLEPTMGAPEGRQSPYDWAWTPLDEAEHDDGDAELGWANEGSQLRLHGDGSGVDREPSLGANGGSNGTDHLDGWKAPTRSATDECEEENEHGTDLDKGELDTSDHEPSLGWTTCGYHGGNDDREPSADDPRWTLTYPEAKANRKAADDAAEAARALRLHKGGGEPLRSPHGNVTIIGPDGNGYLLTSLVTRRAPE